MTEGAHPSPSVNGSAWIVPLLLAAAGGAATAFFDLQTNLPLLDEYARRWTVARIVDGHGLTLWGLSPNLVQDVTMIAPAALRLEPRFWRLTVLLFVALAVASAWLLARRMGASRFWSSVGSVVIPMSALGLSLTTGIQTEIPFLACALAALLFLQGWMEHGRGAPFVCVFATLAVLERQQGVILVASAAVAIGLAGRFRPIERRDLVWLAVLALTVVGALVLTYTPLLGRNPLPPVSIGAGDRPSFLGNAFEVAIFLPAMAGLLLLPFAYAVLRRPGKEEAVPRRRLEMIPVALAVAGITIGGLASFAYHREIFAGPILTPNGLGAPVGLSGPKPAVFGLAVFVPLEISATAAFVVLLVWRRRFWSPEMLPPFARVLVVTGLAQMIPILVERVTLDRYYLMVVAPIVPVVALMASEVTISRVAQGWALASLSAGIAMYVVGEQDYLAWQVARDQAAAIAYRLAPPDAVEAGQEETAVHVWIPRIEDSTGRLPTNVIEQPTVHIEFAAFDDPRVGATYLSIAPGKLVVVAGTGEK